jgi:hypothetical protein
VCEKWCVRSDVRKYKRSEIPSFAILLKILDGDIYSLLSTLWSSYIWSYSSNITGWQRKLDSKIERLIHTNSSGNEVYMIDCNIYMEGSQNQWRNIKRTQRNFDFRQNYKIYITKFIDKLCTKRHKKSGQIPEEAFGWMRPEQASNGLFPWKRDDDDDDDNNNNHHHHH